jgi:hypothetical protein
MAANSANTRSRSPGSGHRGLVFFPLLVPFAVLVVFIATTVPPLLTGDYHVAEQTLTD